MVDIYDSGLVFWLILLFICVLLLGLFCRPLARRRRWLSAGQRQLYALISPFILLEEYLFSTRMEKEPSVLERSQESPPKPILDPESQQDALEEIEKVERVYRKIDLRIIPGKTQHSIHIPDEKTPRYSDDLSCSILDPVLSLLCHPLQCRSCPDNEREATSHARRRAQFEATPSIDWSLALLRLLCYF